MSNGISRVTGLLVIEVVNSNPNGNPDSESDPRQRDNGQGEISPVSFKRKLRDILEVSDGPVCESVIANLPDVPEGYEFHILESRGRDLAVITEELKADQPKKTKKGKESVDIAFDEECFLKSPFVKKYWDARLFGNTFLEKNMDKGFIKTGVVQFGMGVSIASVVIRRHTNTKKAPVDKDRSSGMAPLAYRVVEHGVYVMPFFINPSRARMSGCKPCDVELLKRLIPYAYDHTRSAIRPDVRIRHAWWLEHKNALGSCPDYLLLEALAPKRKGTDPLKPSESWADYDAPVHLPGGLAERVVAKDLMNP
jgi:CRISPR-associated protein Csd2